MRLLEEINLGFTETEWGRYRELIAKRRDESLTEVELAELTSISDRIEALNARRMQCLAELAKLRKVALPVLLNQLGIVPPQVI